MEISPRYDAPPVVEIDGAPDDQRVPFVRQRQRLVDALASLTDEQWATPSRCDGWTVQDVANHLVAVDRFWVTMIEAGVSGTPTRMLVGFDPKATPAALADGMRTMSPSETLEQLRARTDALCETVAALDDAGWNALAESPLGHVPVRLLAHHALWDAWVHERDVLLPLGVQPDEEADEVLSSLRYVAALGPALALNGGESRTGTLVLEVAEPDARVVVDVARLERGAGVVRVHDGEPGTADALVLRGRAVDLLEMLNVRAPLDQPIAPEHRWLVGSLADVFEVASVE